MNKLKKFWPVAIVLLVVLVVALVFTLRDRYDAEEPEDNIATEEDLAVDTSEEEDLDFEEFDNGIVFDEEMEDAEISFKGAEEKDFYGKWTATSGQSIFMYGNVDLDIKEDGTWTGNVVNEDEHGKWTYDGESMVLKGEFFNVTLTYADNGNLIMREDREGDGDYINTVLSRPE